MKCKNATETTGEKQMVTLSKTIPTHYKAYKQIALASHSFQPGYLYSFADVAKLAGLTRQCIAQRAHLDEWPTVKVWVHRSKLRRPYFVRGDFLREIQQLKQQEKKKW